jgi:hypothetical protein
MITNESISHPEDECADGDRRHALVEERDTGAYTCFDGDNYLSIASSVGRRRNAGFTSNLFLPNCALDSTFA